MRINAANLLRERTKETVLNILDINKYEGSLQRCAEVYFTSNGLLLFHCVLCTNDELTDVKELCEHLTNEHQNVFAEKEGSTADAEESADEEYKDYELLDCLAKENEESEAEFIKNDDDDDDENMQSIVEYTITPMEEVFLDGKEKPDIKQEKHVDNENTSASETVEVATTEKPKIKTRGGPLIKDNNSERRYKCSECGLAFKEGYNLRQHLRRHTQADRFKCTQCDKSFHTRTELNTHLRRHTGETPFMCAQCGRQFVTSGALTQHMRRHQNVRPCECDVCGKRFYDTSQLKHHRIVHTRERTHTCSTCNAKFARRKALVTHMKIHANKREYVCQICQTGFNQAPGLRMHLRSKHKDLIQIQEMFNKEKNSA